MQGFSAYGGSFKDEQAARQAAICRYNSLHPDGPPACIRCSGAAAAAETSSLCAADEHVPSSVTPSVHNHHFSESSMEPAADIGYTAGSSASLPAPEPHPYMAAAERPGPTSAQGPASSGPAQRTALLACSKVQMRWLMCRVAALPTAYVGAQLLKIVNRHDCHAHASDDASSFARCSL